MKKSFCLLLAVLVLLPVFALAGCGSPQKVLNVYNWGDYIGEDVIADFEKETGIKVNYSMFSSNEELYAKLTGSSSQYDVIVPSDYMVERMARKDMLAEIDRSKLTNFQNVDPQFQKMAFDPEGKFSVPYMWGTVGIIYNTEMVSDPVDSWSILWNEKYKKQILMYDSSRDSISVALLYKGLQPNATDDAALKTAEEALIAQKPLVLSYTLDDTRDKILAGEAAMAVVYSGDAVLIAQEADSPEQFAYSIPKEGSNIFMDNLCIVKNARHKEEAMKFIDFMLRPDIAARNAEYIGYSTPEKAAYDQLSEELKAIPAYYATPEEQARLTAYRDLGDEATARYEDVWTRLKGSN